MSNLSTTQARIERMIRQDEENQKLFYAVDDMWHMKWNLPNELAQLDWIRPEVSSDPHDAIRAGTRVLATIMPKLSIDPTAPNQETRDATDRMERALMWHFENACKRRHNPLHDIVRHAMLYDKVTAQVVYLPHQQSTYGVLPEKIRKQASARYGPFAVIVRDPKDVFVDYSDWGIERVVHRYKLGARELVDIFGENASKVQTEIEKDKYDGMDMWYTVYDYTILGERLIYAARQDSREVFAPPEDPNAITIVDDGTDLEWLPWIVRTGGDELIPMLYSIYKTGQWESQNIFETIMSSEVIAYAAAPRGVLTTINEENTETQYGDPNRDKIIRPGDRFQQLRPPEIDQSMHVMSERIGSRMAKSTIPNVIQTGDFPSGTAFATLNLATQSGVKALNPYKRLAEQAVADIFAHMLYWIEYVGETVISNPTNPLSPTGQTEYIEIRPDEIDVEQLYMKVELTPDVPTDRMARINGAVMSNQNLLYSNRRALEDIGVTDPGSEIEQWYEEQTRRRDWELEQEGKQMQMQQEIELAGQAQMMQMQLQAEQQAQGGAQPAPGEVPPSAEEAQAGYARQRGAGFQNTRDSAGFNPAIGGEPPAEANPEGTRETQQGANISTSGNEGGAF
jgi:hypothetical protein